jgi:hypothetical protein
MVQLNLGEIMDTQIPLVVEFAPGSHIQPTENSDTPLPRDALIRFSDGREIPVPADQIVSEDEERGAARVGFGGLSFEGMVDGRLAFWRVYDLAPDEMLAPDRDIRFLIDPDLVSSVEVRGVKVWPEKSIPISS